MKEKNIRTGTPRRIGIVAASRDLGVTYGHLYKAVRHMNGDRGAHARQPGRSLAAAIRARYPELLNREAQ